MSIWPAQSGRRYAWIGLLWLLILTSSAGVAAAQTPLPAFVSEVEYTFGQVMIFHLTVEEGESIESVTLFFRVPEFSSTYTAQRPIAPEERQGRGWHWSHPVDLSTVQLAPFTTVTYWWLLQTEAGEDIVLPEQTLVYEDTQFEWRTLTQDKVTVHWVGEDVSLGQTALDVVAETLPRLEAFVPLADQTTFRIYIYPTTADLRAALRLTGRDWVGAHTVPELGVILVTVVNTRTAATDLRQSLPHELLHFLLYQVTGVGYEQLPVWFNEGLASYVEATPRPGYEAILTTAVANQDTIPFTQLCQAFPTTEDEVLLAYAQSTGLIRFIQARYGNQVLRDLVAAFADGADCESGVRRALQMSVTDLDHLWLRQLQPRAPWVQFLVENGLWFLLVMGGFGIASLFVLTKPFPSNV